MTDAEWALLRHHLEDCIGHVRTMLKQVQPTEEVLVLPRRAHPAPASFGSGQKFQTLVAPQTYPD